MQSASALHIPRQITENMSAMLHLQRLQPGPLSSPIRLGTILYWKKLTRSSPVARKYPTGFPNERTEPFVPADGLRQPLSSSVRWPIDRASPLDVARGARKRLSSDP